MGKIINEAERSLAAGSIGAGYTNIETVTLHPARIAILQNLTNQTVTFSIDGGDTACVTIAANGGVVLDLTANTGNSINDHGDFLGMGIQFKVKHIGVAPTTGSVYVSLLYRKGE
ncbi:MAG TPA: hypothetical protein VI911_07515 [Patescibacteria group bacterium]|nr:hypothetical protein [Patescibacteria group bacterium]